MIKNFAFSQSTSLQIKYIRILCIYFMIIVQIPPWMKEAYIRDFFEPIKILFYDIFVRSSVTALSYVSSFLIYFGLINKSRRTISFTRFKSIVLPLVFWNLLMIIFSAGMFYIKGSSYPGMESIAAFDLLDFFFNGLLALNSKPATGSLAFLRDFFVCSLLSSCLVFAIRKIGFYAILIVLAIHTFYSFEPIVMRSTILVAFTIGIYVAHKVGELKISSYFREIYILAPSVVLSVEFSILSEKFFLYDTFKRAGLSLLFINISYVLALKTKSFIWRERITNIANITSLIYLSHSLAFLFFWGVWNILIADKITPEYLVFFLLLPPFCFYFIYRLAPFSSYLSFPLQFLITGKKQ
ncbi:hypothetical protein I633_08400 [Alteromonas mediterranea 615]|uniref:Acyltransferase 3 domain-containing protein n=1 Tax=Alteromonas mediterranea 615 TaxID=1300253 RepID=S5AC27_9ALTE|nr:hypothetical protein I633_08400 [Alteromonas mediterranea 615]